LRNDTNDETEDSGKSTTKPVPNIGDIAVTIGIGI
jgi:hypothetical protein